MDGEILIAFGLGRWCPAAGWRRDYLRPRGQKPLEGGVNLVVNGFIWSERERTAVIGDRAAAIAFLFVRFCSMNIENVISMLSCFCLREICDGAFVFVFF